MKQLIVFLCVKVLDDESGLKLEISPSSGCVPAKGVMELKISMLPIIPGTFDTKVYIGIRESETLFARITGSVETPKISVDKVIIRYFISVLHCVVIF